MSQENVEALRRANEAINRADKAAWLSTCAPDAVMIPAREWPENAPVRGAGAIWDYYAEAAAPWEDGRFELGEIVESQGDAVVANIRRDARGKASGAGVLFSYWVVTRFRHGQQSRIEWFSERPHALDAAGLTE